MSIILQFLSLLDIAGWLGMIATVISIYLYPKNIKLAGILGCFGNICIIWPSFVFDLWSLVVLNLILFVVNGRNAYKYIKFIKQRDKATRKSVDKELRKTRAF